MASQQDDSSRSLIFFRLYECVDSDTHELPQETSKGIKTGQPFVFTKEKNDRDNGKSAIPITINRIESEDKDDRGKEVQDDHDDRHGATYKVETDKMNCYIGVDWLIEHSHAIQVKPKLDKSQAETTDVLKMFFSCLEHPEVAKETGNLYNIHFDKPFVEIQTTDDILSPLLIIHYLRIIHEIVRKGLKKSYYPISENLQGRIKGKIDIGRTLKKNLFACKASYHYCRYQEFGVNTIENRILKKALLFCQRAMASYSTGQKKSWLKYAQPLFDYCLPAFSAVDEHIELHALRHFWRNAFYREYDEALRVARLILRRFGYTIKNTESGTTTRVPPFWIDMSNLFELYVLKILKEAYGKEIRYHKNVPSGEPDYLHTAKKLIIDAKYKPWYKNDPSDKQQRPDIRQLSGYARDVEVLKILGINNKAEQDTTVIDCIIIYPDRAGAEGIDLNDLSNKEIKGFTRFYKIGIKVPVV